MKTLLLTAAALAAFATPALAQSGPVGSVGVALGTSEADLGGLTADSDGGVVDVNVAGTVLTDWTVTLVGSAGWADGELDEDKVLAGQVHLTRKMGDLRAGGFVAVSEVGDDTLTSLGAEVQKYMGAMTLTGSVAFSTMDEADAISVSGDVAYYPMDNLRLNAGLSGGSVEFTGTSAEFYSFGTGAEYQFKDTPISVFAGYDRTTFDDLDLDVDTVSVGLRFSFGAGGLKAREESGADLGRSIGGLAGALSGL